TICISAVVVILARPCFAIFTDSEIVIDYACNMVYNMVPFYFLMAATRIYVGVISGAGNSVTPMIINIMFMCVFRVIFLPGISVVIGRCLRGMYYTYWISWVMTLICVAFYYYLRMKKRIEDA
ncbi:MAG: MATE family efflux transporter, partial [Acetivibrio ethanolgignens]